MTSRRFALLASMFVAGLLATARTGLAQSYGPGEQVLVIGSAAFRPISGNLADGQIGNDDGYLKPTAGGSTAFTAPVTLPEGALITGMCLYAYDGDDLAVTSEIHAFKLVPGGTNPGKIIVPGTYVATAWNFGYGVICTGPLAFTYRTTGDIDNDGTAENVNYQVAVDLQGSSSNTLGGVRIFWSRQVSPAPGSATFNDVPTTDPAFQHIEALVASGITAGCGGGNYCPDAALTRRQMAIFLAKALGLHWGE